MQWWVAILILLTVLRSFLFIYCILLLVYVFWVICKFMMFGLSEGYLYLSCSFFQYYCIYDLRNKDTVEGSGEKDLMGGQESGLDWVTRTCQWHCRTTYMERILTG